MSHDENHPDLLPVDADATPPADGPEEPLVRPRFKSVGESISGPIVWGVVLMAVGQLMSIFGDVDLVVLAGLLSVVGILVVLLGVARMGQAVQYLAMRERDREHGLS